MIILRKLSQINPDIPLVWKLFSESFHEHERIIFSDLFDSDFYTHNITEDK